jgi:hypothetical protein
MAMLFGKSTQWQDAEKIASAPRCRDADLLLGVEEAEDPDRWLNPDGPRDRIIPLGCFEGLQNGQGKFRSAASIFKSLEGGANLRLLLISSPLRHSYKEKAEREGTARYQHRSFE